MTSAHARTHGRGFVRSLQSFKRKSLSTTVSPPTQEELLLSILPKHIADEMLQGMKEQAQQQEVQQQQQFNTMYMYRHENVRSGPVDLVNFSRRV